MVNKFCSFILFLLISVSGYSLSMGVDGGISYFEYAEVSTNNKDDLFKITAVTGGLSLEEGRFSNFLGVQIPLNLYFEDALGADEKNYIYDFVYFGISEKFAYTVLDGNNIDLNFLISVNYFLLRDHYDMDVTEYDFLTAGPGVGVKLLFNPWSFLKIYLNSEVSFNFPLFFRWDRNFLWSYSGYINAGILYQF